MKGSRHSYLSLRVGDQDKARLRRLVEAEELTASAVVRRLIRDRASELGPSTEPVVTDPHIRVAEDVR